MLMFPHLQSAILLTLLIASNSSSSNENTIKSKPKGSDQRIERSVFGLKSIPSSEKRNTSQQKFMTESNDVKPVSFHVVGDAYVDFFCFLDGEWPENGGDSRLTEAVKSYAGGSSTNTATHLKSLIRNFSASPTLAGVVLHTVLNPNDQYGKILLDHAAEHDFELVNCRKSEVDTASTGHCIAIVSGGERSFMTHQGCVGTFSASRLHVERMIDTDGPIHVHVAGYYNIGGFWNGDLLDQLSYIKHERTKRFPQWTTTISLVPQHDASKEWDGGIDDVIRQLDFVIMNEVEASRIVRRGLGITSSSDCVQDWITYFSSLNPAAVVIVTKGAKGAIAFRNGEILGSLERAASVNVIDPTGAGDSFTAGFLHELWAWKQRRGDETCVWPQEAIQNALLWGCAVGAAAVTVRGASVPCAPEFIQELYEQEKTSKFLTMATSETPRD